MRFAIVGAGGLGGYYGARLAEAGHEVAFIARGAHLDAIRKNGLKVFSPLGDTHLNDVVATNDPRDVGLVDVIVVAVKTWQIADAARAMQPMIKADTIVVPFLNGVEAPDELASIVGAEHVVGGLSKVFSLVEAPGVVRHFNPGAYVEIGELGGGLSERVEKLRAAFESAGSQANSSADIRTELWKKLLTVSSWAGLGALARSPMGVLRGMAETRALIDRAMDEGIAVGARRGHPITAAYKAELWKFYDAMPADATASMQRDLMAGKPSELDAWNGAIVRFGAETGVDTPVQTFTYHALLPMERRARGLI
jgi:2-dehydropantoate 2-reductase